MSLESKPAKNEFSLNSLTRLGLSGMLDAATYEREADRRPPDSILDRVFDNALFVEIRNTGSLCDEYQPLEIIDCAIKPGTGKPWIIENVVLDCQAPTGGTPRHNFVIPLQPMGNNDVGQAVITGLVNCKVYFSGANLTWCRRCDMDAGRNTLAATPEGSAEIVWRDATATIPGDVDCIVNLAPAVDVTYSGITKQDILPGGSGPVSLYQNDTDTTYEITANLNHMEQGLQVSANKEVKVTWYHMEKEWRIDGAECEDTGDPPLTYWNGEWTESQSQSGLVGPPYERGWMMRDGLWLMVANKQTSDRPGPIPSDTPKYLLPDAGPWTSNQAGTVTQFWYGNQFTLTSGVFLTGYRIWIPGQDAGAQVEYNVAAVVNPGQVNEEVSWRTWAPLPAEGWLTIPIGADVEVSGSVLELWLGMRSIATPSSFTYEWSQKNQNGTPDNGSGEMWFQDNQTEMRFSRDDNNGTNRGAELALITPGSTIQAAGRTWNVLNTSVQGNGNVFYDVEPGGQRPGEADRDWTFTYYVGGDITYDTITGYWPSGNPAFLTGQGVVTTTSPLDRPNVSTSNNAGSTDLLITDAIVSDDWDLMAYSG